MNAQRSTPQSEQPQFMSILVLHVAMVVALAATLTLVFACGESAESGYGYPGEPGAPGSLDERGALSLPMIDRDDRSIVQTVEVEKEVELAKEKIELDEIVLEKEISAATDIPASMAEESAQNTNISTQPTNRIIVRNADMSVESNDPAATIAAISDLAVRRGGWVVNSSTIEEGSYYYITIRIPAESLDAVIEQISTDVEKVLSSQSDSTDFTEEYIDLGARRSTVQETVEALTQLLKNENYDSVQELLEVQREITNWQSELERIDGRLAFISESAAFSRLSISVNRSPVPMRVDVGEDVNVGIGIGRKYTARFFPPEGYDRFEIVWDFGDGTPPQTVQSGLQTQGDDGYLSVPVRHTYQSDELSPHVVTATVKAFSDRGLAEGEDQLWANVSELPRLDAFVTTSQWSVEEGQPVTLTASFNHPDTLRNVSYSWDFRDGSSVVEGMVAPADTGVEIEHTFDRHRPESYEIVFEVRGDSDAGEVEETHYAYVSVHPGPEIESSDFDPGNTATSAVNTLIAVTAFAGTAGIWLAITSPIWIILGAIIFFIVRFIIRRQRNVQRVVYVPTQVDEDQESDEENEATSSA